MNRSPCAVGEYYHVYNRGVDKRAIFEDTEDIQRFYTSMLLFNSTAPIGSIYETQFKRREKNTNVTQLRGPTPKFQAGDKDESLVSCACYCLNPNHFHHLYQLHQI